MRKRLITLLCAALAAAMLLGACGANEGEPPRTSDEMTVVAQMDGQSIYMYEVIDWLKLLGLSESALRDSSYRDELLDYVVDQMVTEVEVKNKGYLDNLTEDQTALAESYADYDIQRGMQNTGMTEEQVIESIGMTKEDLIEKYKINIAASVAFEELVGEVEISDEELKAEYDINVASQKEQMDADPALYVDILNDGITTYYTPAGVRGVRRIVIAFDDDTAGAIQMLRREGYDGQADVVRQDGLEKIKLKANEVLDKLGEGTSFSDMLEELTKDIENAEESRRELPVVKGVDVYGEEFINAAMELEAIGKFSQLIATDEGYQILEYTSDLKQGAADFESVKEVIRSNVIPDKQNKAWDDIIKQWRDEHKVIAYYENLVPKPSPNETK